MASTPVYCSLCRLPYDDTRFMIKCDMCQIWFHGTCVGVEKEAAADIELYHCNNCEVLHGPSVMKRCSGSSKGPNSPEGTPVKTGSPMFIQELQHKTSEILDAEILKLRSIHLTVAYLEKNGFNVPIWVSKKDGLGMILPPPPFTLRDVEKYVGSDKEIDVIDVYQQADCKMKLRDFVHHYYNGRREKIFNVINLDFSNTSLYDLVEPPRIVRRLSWLENLYSEYDFERPNVYKYCLISMKDSYTDFYISCGGTSVWYHMIKGKKIFYLIRPTNENLNLFESWSNSPNQKEVFFGDQVDKCYKCCVMQGQTFFIPSGWIHAVLTPVDSLAFGGKFLHSYDMEMQLRVYEIKNRLSTVDLFKFPNFETICWCVGKDILDILQSLRESEKEPVSFLVVGGKALILAFRSWTRKEVLQNHQGQIPQKMQFVQFIKDLAREIRLVEMRTTGACLSDSDDDLQDMDTDENKSCQQAQLMTSDNIKKQEIPSDEAMVDRVEGKPGDGAGGIVNLPDTSSETLPCPSSQETVKVMPCTANLQSSSSSSASSTMQAWSIQEQDQRSESSTGELGTVSSSPASLLPVLSRKKTIKSRKKTIKSRKKTSAQQS